MLQIRDKKAYRKHIETMNPINAKSVQLVELHAFAYCLLFVYLSESFDFLKVSILNVIVLASVLVVVCLTSVRTSLCTALSTCLSIHFSAGCLECSLEFSACSIDTSQILSLVSVFQFLESCFNRSLLICRNLIAKVFQLIFSSEDQAVGLVQFVDTFLFLLVGFCISFCFSFHTVDFFLAQAR